MHVSNADRCIDLVITKNLIKMMSQSGKFQSCYRLICNYKVLKFCKVEETGVGLIVKIRHSREGGGNQISGRGFLGWQLLNFSKIC